MQNSSVVQKLNSVAVSLYKVIGFVVLSLIVAGVTAYLAVNLFYLSNRGWVAPVILNAQHSEVLEANGKLLTQRNSRDKLEVEKLEVAAELEHAERAIAAAQDFHKDFARSIRADISARQQELSEVNKHLRQIRREKRAFVKAQRTFARMRRREARSDLKAGLIGRIEFANARYVDSQIANAQLQFAEKEVEFRQRRETLRREIRSLNEVLLSPERAGSLDNLSVEAVLLVQNYRESQLELMRLQRERSTLAQAMKLADANLRDYDKVISNLQSSPYLRALDAEVTLAFAPYENLQRLQPGMPVYGCKLSIVLCKEVGRVVNVLDGEVDMAHPMWNRQVRGRMVEIETQDSSWGQQTALHVGRKPFML